MTAVLYLLGVVLFVIGVAASIGLHELGHLIPGKLYNVKITQYFIGFGRTVWSTRRGETEYGVKAIPLGGYVKLVGMLPPGPDAEPGTVSSRNTGMFAQLVSDARAQEYEHVGPHDHDRLFYKLPWWKRVIIMVSGVSINIALAFVLFAIVFMGYGVLEPNRTVARVYECVKVVQGNETAGACSSSDPETPAKKAGLRPGDEIVSFNGTAVRDYDQLQQRIRANRSGAATIVVDRGGRRLTLHTDTTVTGLPDLKHPDKTVQAGFLGIAPQQTNVRQGPGYVVDQMASSTWGTLQAIGALPQKVYHVARAALGLEKRASDSPMSVVGAGRVAGELVSDQHFSLVSRLMTLLLLLAGLNLFLGLINLVPLPPFDGGGIATTLVEAVRRGIARVLKRPDPGVLDPAKLLPVTYAMASVILVVSVVLVWADLVAPVRINQ